jgi:hypothetical protein
MSSTINLLVPYGLMGNCGWSSRRGRAKGIPYVAQVEENTSLSMPASSAAAKSVIDPETLLSKKATGSLIEWLTSIKPPK